MCLLVAFLHHYPLGSGKSEVRGRINQVVLEGIRSCRECHVGVWLYGCIRWELLHDYPFRSEKVEGRGCEGMHRVV